MGAPLDAIREFLKLESASGILLMGAGALAVLAANSPLASIYDSLWQVPLALSVGSFALAKPLLLWINDGLMAVFFLLVGLELKREVLEGELSDRSQIVLPVAGAIGGMLVPALIYTACNLGDSAAMRGWAISIGNRYRIRTRDPGPARFARATAVESAADDTCNA